CESCSRSHILALTFQIPCALASLRRLTRITQAAGHQFKQAPSPWLAPGTLGQGPCRSDRLWAAIIEKGGGDAAMLQAQGGRIQGWLGAAKPDLDGRGNAARGHIGGDRPPGHR